MNMWTLFQTFGAGLAAFLFIGGFIFVTCVGTVDLVASPTPSEIREKNDTTLREYDKLKELLDSDPDYEDFYWRYRKVRDNWTWRSKTSSSVYEYNNVKPYMIDYETFKDKQRNLKDYHYLDAGYDPHRGLILVDKFDIERWSQETNYGIKSLTLVQSESDSGS
jgi:hypothetical protein